MARVEVVLDIDQTLAGGVVSAHMGYYNRRLGLGMTADQIRESDGYAKTFDVPQIVSFRNGGNGAEEAMFQQVRSEIRTSSEVHLDLRELPGSVDGARSLVGLGDISYYTVRPPEVEDATKQWLANKGFPDPEHVVICSSPKDKLERIIADKLVGQENDGELPTVVLIDDSYKQLAEAATEIVQTDPDMRKYMERIVLVGFGLQSPTAEMEGSFYPQSGLRTIALPSWEQAGVHAVRQTVEAK